jgi:CubicO group peptidase (beta-lactamase class C family)
VKIGRSLSVPTLAVALSFSSAAAATSIAIVDGKWQLNGEITYRGAKAEGLLMNMRAVNATFEDRNRSDFDPDANTAEFIAQIPAYVAAGMRAFTLNLQGGMPGYEGAVNSVFAADGSLRPEPLARVQRVIEACDRHGAAVILGCFYQRQDQILRDAEAVRAAVVNVVKWIESRGYRHVVLEVTNEFGHRGFDHALLKTHEGQAELLRLARQTLPRLLVGTSETGGRTGYPPAFFTHVVPASDFVLIHLNLTPVEQIAARLAALKGISKPIVCNEDDKIEADGARAAEICVEHRVSWGLMLQKKNQHFPFEFDGVADDPAIYAKVRELTTARSAYFPVPESRGGWRVAKSADEIRALGVDPDRLDRLRDWLLASDDRNFAAVVIRRGHIVLEVERGNSAKTDARRVASVSKAICATVLAIASELSQRGETPRRMTFDDLAFPFIPWAQPLSDPRKTQITVKQLFNHTSGICPESTGASNTGTWDYVLGHNGDERLARLAFDPGKGSGYSTHALYHAALVCETVTGMQYDQFAIKHLFEPIGCEHWWFQYFESEKHGRHANHAMGMPARDLARIAYCMLRGGEWNGRSVIPRWFVEQTARPSHDLEGVKELRTGRDATSYSHAWELPVRSGDKTDEWMAKIPHDARFKRGSGGQLIAFVPSLDLVVTRQTGGSGQWSYEEYLARACEAVLGR